MRLTALTTMGMLLAGGLSLNGCAYMHWNHYDHAHTAEHRRYDVDVERNGRHDANVDVTVKKPTNSTNYDIRNRREYEANAEARLSRYEAQWRDLGRRTGNAGERARQDAGNLGKGIESDLHKAGRDLKALRASTNDHWQKYRRDWEDLMDRIGNSLERHSNG